MFSEYEGKKLKIRPCGEKKISTIYLPIYFNGLFFVIWTNPRNNEQHGNNEQRALMITFLSSNVEELCCVNSSSKFEEKILKIGLGRIIHLWFVFCHLGFAKNKPQNVT